ncbi:MAG: hypothetical protein J6V49_07600 [Bacteroidales bacterium]|nr:hypothetical protein [Bacteroidales bacterium]
MTNQEKKAQLAVLISPDIAEDPLLSTLLTLSEGIVLNRRYPLGIPEGATVPMQYEHIQLQIALELFSKMGAEGQTAHNENGINRTYESAGVSNSLLQRITPICGSVR